VKALKPENCTGEFAGPIIAAMWLAADEDAAGIAAVISSKVTNTAVIYRFVGL
jgi:hypothetical protein